MVLMQLLPASGAADADRLAPLATTGRELSTRSSRRG